MLIISSTFPVQASFSWCGILSRFTVKMSPLSCLLSVCTQWGKITIGRQFKPIVHAPPSAQIRHLPLKRDSHRTQQFRSMTCYRGCLNSGSAIKTKPTGDSSFTTNPSSFNQVLTRMLS